jgi:hypothetical protein
VTQFGDTGPTKRRETFAAHQKKNEEMSEYYLSDPRDQGRARKRSQQEEGKSTAESQNMKVTLLGDLLFPAGEPRGFDPYNSVQGQSTRDAWRTTRGRR